MSAKDKFLDLSAYTAAGTGGLFSIAEWNEMVGLIAGALGIFLCVLRIWAFFSKRRQHKAAAASGNGGE